MVPPNQNDSLTGSPVSGEPVYLAIGRLRRSHGLRGEIILELMTDFPERITPGRTVYIGSKYQEYILKTVRPHGAYLLISFDPFSTPEAVSILRNQMVYTQSESLPPLPEGEYYFHELVGLQVLDENGQILGVLEEILETGANDIYLVRQPNDEELLLPVIEQVILKVDLERKVIVVRPQIWE